MRQQESIRSILKEESQKQSKLLSSMEETIENFYIFNSDRLKNILFEAEKKTNILIKKNWLKDRSED